MTSLRRAASIASNSCGSNAADERAGAALGGEDAFAQPSTDAKARRYLIARDLSVGRTIESYGDERTREPAGRDLHAGTVDVIAEE